MIKIIYEVVEHDGGWAYKVGDVLSETYPTAKDAQTAAHRAAKSQEMAGESTDIEYQDASGTTRREFASGDDRPDAEVAPTQQD